MPGKLQTSPQISSYRRIYHDQYHGGVKGGAHIITRYGRAVEFEPRFFGLRYVCEREGTFEADFGLKVKPLTNGMDG